MGAVGGPTISEDYRYEVDRINSFVGWPLNETHKPERLASVGFVYTGEGTLVQCFHRDCGIKYRAWSKGDNPLSVHQKCNPRCPFLRTFACKQKSPSLEPHIYGQCTHQAAVGYNGVVNNSPGINCDAQLSCGGSFDNNSRVFMPENCQHLYETERTKLLVGWALNKVVNSEHPGRQQNEINMLVEAEGNHFSTSQQPQDHPSTMPQDHQSTMPQNHPSAMPVLHLPGHPDLMAFPDNSLPQQYSEQSESEDRGGIDPFKFDVDSEVDQTHAEQVAAVKHVESPTILSMHHDEEKKPLLKLSIDDTFKSCNVDFSDLWMVRLNSIKMLFY